MVIGGSKGDDITTYNKLLAEVGLTDAQMSYITYDSTGDGSSSWLSSRYSLCQASVPATLPRASDQKATAASLMLAGAATPRHTGTSTFS